MKTRIRRARCKFVLAVLNNQLEKLELIREEVHPSVGESSDALIEIAVVRSRGWEVYVPLDTVVFLENHKNIQALHAEAVESARRMTAAEGLDFLVRAGIYTPEGELTAEYGGPKQKRLRRPKPRSKSSPRT